jgi:hypothetical protein
MDESIEEVAGIDYYELLTNYSGEEGKLRCIELVNDYLSDIRDGDVSWRVSMAIRELENDPIAKDHEKKWRSPSSDPPAALRIQ